MWKPNLDFSYASLNLNVNLNALFTSSYFVKCLFYLWKKKDIYAFYEIKNVCFSEYCFYDSIVSECIWRTAFGDFMS